MKQNENNVVFLIFKNQKWKRKCFLKPESWNFTCCKLFFIIKLNLKIFFSLNRCRFKCIDLDGNGVLTPNEMLFFYEEQLHRMECMAQEPVLFEDILCQIVDMIAPEVSPLFLFLHLCLFFFFSSRFCFIPLPHRKW